MSEPAQVNIFNLDPNWYFSKLWEWNDWQKWLTNLKANYTYYALDSTKIQTELGWQLAEPFETGIQKAIDWYLEHQSWWEKVRSGEYRDYYAVQYENRLKQAWAAYEWRC